jgi:hypothetical protein
VAAGLNGSSFLLGEALGNVTVTAIIAFSSSAAWQASLVDRGMTPDQAAEAYASAQRAVFLVTAHPFSAPSYLDLASQVPGWVEVFTAGFTGAMIVLAAVAVLASVVAHLGLRLQRTTAPPTTRATMRPGDAPRQPAARAARPSRSRRPGR